MGEGGKEGRKEGGFAETITYIHTYIHTYLSTLPPKRWIFKAREGKFGAGDLYIYI